jgi:acetyl esterase/lipase
LTGPGDFIYIAFSRTELPLHDFYRKEYEKMPSEELDTIIRMLNARDENPDASVEEMRAAFEKEARLIPLAEDVISEALEMGGVPAEWITVPGAAEDRILFYLHGGGYCVGSLNTHREMISRLARAGRARALSIEYRLAPEHLHPAALEDSVAAYRGLLSDGADPARIVIGGDSAGGGLTLATLVSLRDAGDPLPAAAVCLSPWTDLEGTGESATTKADLDMIVKMDDDRTMARRYSGDADLREPLLSPLYADLHGLPPMLIQVGTREVLLDDSTRFADSAREAGVDVALEVWEDMIHVFQFFAFALPEGQQAVDRIGEFMLQRLP